MRITFEVIANHFGKVIRQIFWHCESFLADCESLIKWYRQDFFGPHPFFRQNFPLFKHTLNIIMMQECEYIANNDSQLRITLQKCVAIVTR